MMSSLKSCDSRFHNSRFFLCFSLFCCVVPAFGDELTEEKIRAVIQRIDDSIMSGEYTAYAQYLAPDAQITLVNKSGEHAHRQRLSRDQFIKALKQGRGGAKAYSYDRISLEIEIGGDGNTATAFSKTMETMNIGNVNMGFGSFDVIQFRVEGGKLIIQDIKSSNELVYQEKRAPPSPATAMP